MRYVYVIMEYDDIIFITSNFNTAAGHWWNERRQVLGRRPDVYKWELGKRGKYEYITDDEMQEYINLNWRNINA